MSQPGDGWSILGLPFQTSDQGFDGEVALPVAALVVVKTLDDDGSVTFRVRATEGLTLVEAFGMAQYGADRLRAGFAHNQADGDPA